MLTETEGGLARLVSRTYRREDRRLQICRLQRRPGERVRTIRKGTSTERGPRDSVRGRRAQNTLPAR
eukprot:8999322-Pyramimonas_sp.AAC.1